MNSQCISICTGPNNLKTPLLRVLNFIFTEAVKSIFFFLTCPCSLSFAKESSVSPRKFFPNVLVLIFSWMVNGQATTNHSFNKQFKDLWLSKSKCIIGFILHTTYLPHCRIHSCQVFQGFLCIYMKMHPVGSILNETSDRYLSQKNGFWHKSSFILSILNSMAKIVPVSDMIISKIP